jgi:hypothetical protein
MTRAWVRRRLYSAWHARWPWSLIGLPVVLALVAGLCLLGLTQGTASHHPLRLDAALSAGVERVTDGRLTLGRPELLVLLAAILFLFRRTRLDWLAFRPGAIEVPMLDSGGLDSLDPQHPEQPQETRLSRLTIEFREYLASCRVYETTTVPGDLETERIIEVFKTTQPNGWLASLAAAWSYIWPGRAYVVTATLRLRPETPRYGVSVVVRRLPGRAVELETQWSSDHSRALQRAAFAVTAHVLPFTRACRNPPWPQWYRHRSPMPMELMRHYQRAKLMVGERRYDEALSLYHSALLYDADNVHLRYDVGQIFERLQLYPDALAQYAEITERLFPVQPAPAAPKASEVDPADPGQRRRRLPRVPRRAGDRPDTDPAHQVTRSLAPSHSPRTDAFLVRYRYLSALGTARRLANELLAPDWDELQQWLHWQGRAGDDRGPLDHPAGGMGHRPWRTTELMDLRRRLAEQLDPIWQEHLAGLAVLGGPRSDPGLGLSGVLLDDAGGSSTPAFVADLPPESGWRRLRPEVARLFAVEQYLLAIAQAETALMLADFTRRVTRRRRGRSSSLTVVTLRLMALSVQYRQQRFSAALEAHAARTAGAAAPDAPATAQWWPPPLDDMNARLAEAGYDAGSDRWLEHYTVACLYAQAVQDDVTEVLANRRHAEAAVRALDRAQRCGDDVEFVISKRYWLLAGDPDLAGLRRYDCFRAFESRVYLHPQPTTDAAKYELLHYLRQGLARGAQQMEQLWTTRAGTEVTALDTATMETWFREERRAWEICVRLGRFYRQWQTRSSGLDSLRNLIARYGGDPMPVPYPEVIRDYVLIGVGEPTNVDARISGMETLFAHLAVEMGNAASLDGEQETNGSTGTPTTIIDKTRAWIWYLEHCTRGQARYRPTQEEFTQLCAQRAAVWAGLRHWTTTPARRSAAALDVAVRLVRLPDPPAEAIDVTGFDPADHNTVPPPRPSSADR